MKPELTSAYLEAANESRVGTESWWGPVILGREAIYIVQERRAELPVEFVFALLVLLDYVLRRTTPQKELMGTPYSELPAWVRGHRDWPISKQLSCPVVVIPRDRVEILYHKRGPVELRFRFQGTTVSITHGRLAAKRIRAFLWGAGWPTMWDDDRLNLPEDSLLADLELERQRLFRMPPVARRFVGIGAALALLPVLISLVPHLNETLVEVVCTVGVIAGLLLMFFGGVALRRGI